MKKIPFNIELYNTGKYDVVTRNDESVEIINTNLRNTRYPISGYIGDATTLTNYTKCGKYSLMLDTVYDLFLIEKLTFKDAYYNIYFDCILGPHYNIQAANTLASPSRLSILKLRIFSNGDVKILETIKNER